MDRDEHEVTRLLAAARNGDGRAVDDLFDAVYQELRRLAHSKRAGWHGAETLNTTALVHEAYLKLAGSEARWEDRGHFFAVAAKAMRRILIDRARYALAQRRGGGAIVQPLTGSADLPAPDVPEELISLDDALTRLEALDPRQARVVECRFFAGLDVAETAAAVGASTATIKRDWRAARAWLYRELQDAGASP